MAHADAETTLQKPVFVRGFGARDETGMAFARVVSNKITPEGLDFVTRVRSRNNDLPPH